MKHKILIPNKRREAYWEYNLTFKYSKYLKIHVEQVCLFFIIKNHDHSYYFEYFFYDTLKIGHNTYNSKKELYSAIQKLLKENVLLEQKL